MQENCFYQFCVISNEKSLRFEQRNNIFPYPVHFRSITLVYYYLAAIPVKPDAFCTNQRPRIYLKNKALQAHKPVPRRNFP